MPTVAEIVSSYPIAQYLAANSINKQGLYGGGVNNQLPEKIYNIGRSVERTYNDDPSDDTLQETANYLWTLCGRFGLEALVVAQASGSVSPVTPTSSLPLPITFFVSASSLIPTGSNSVTISSFIGYNLAFNRNNVPQAPLNDGSGSYFSWNRNTGEFVCYGDANVGELFQLIPIG